MWRKTWEKLLGRAEIRKGEAMTQHTKERVVTGGGLILFLSNGMGLP